MRRRDFLKTVGAAGTAWAVARTRSRAGLIAAPPAATGNGDWSRFGYDLQNTRFNPVENTLGVQNVEKLKLKWSFPVSMPIQNTPCVVGDQLYLDSWNGNFYALETGSGELLWKFNTETPLTSERTGARDLRSSPQYADGKLFFGNGNHDSSAFCLDAKTGKLLWKTVLDDDVEGNQAHVSSSPTYYDGMVFFGTSSGQAHIYCLDGETGAVRWRFRTVPTAEAGGGSLWTSPAIDEEHEILYNGTGSVKSFMPPGPMLYTESILANDLRSGQLLWYYQARPADPFDLDFGCHPMLFDAVGPAGRAVRKCVVAGSKAGMFCLERYTGELLWKVMLTNRSAGGGPLMSSTAVAYNRVYVVSNAYGERPMSVSVALNAYTGDIEWWVPNESTHKAPVAVANGVFYQGLVSGELQALNAKTGRLLWEDQLPSAHRGGITISNGMLFTSNGESTLNSAPTTNLYGVYAFSLDGE